MSHTFVQEEMALIKYKGLIDLDGLFDMIFQWMMDNEFSDFNEEVHKNKMPEIEKSWVGYRKRTEYVAESVIFECHFFGVKPVEVVKDGKKKKMYQARGEMRFKLKVETDWEEKWETSAFWERMRDFYDNYIIKQNLLIKFVDPLEQKVIGLTTKVKEFLGMEAA